MDVALKGRKRRFNGGGVTWVSILVLVDVALKVGLEARDAELEQACFNPCFGGCRSESDEKRLLADEIDRVSILVFVDVALKDDFKND